MSGESATLRTPRVPVIRSPGSSIDTRVAPPTSMNKDVKTVSSTPSRNERSVRWTFRRAEVMRAPAGMVGASRKAIVSATLPNCLTASAPHQLMPNGGAQVSRFGHQDFAVHPVFSSKVKPPGRRCQMTADQIGEAAHLPLYRPNANSGNPALIAVSWPIEGQSQIVYWS